MSHLVFPIYIQVNRKIVYSYEATSTIKTLLPFVIMNIKSYYVTLSFKHTQLSTQSFQTGQTNVNKRIHIVKGQNQQATLN